MVKTTTRITHPFVPHFEDASRCAFVSGRGVACPATYDNHPRPKPHPLDPPLHITTAALSDLAHASGLVAAAHAIDPGAVHALGQAGRHLRQAEQALQRARTALEDAATLMDGGPTCGAPTVISFRPYACTRKAGHAGPHGSGDLVWGSVATGDQLRRSRPQSFLPVSSRFDDPKYPRGIDMGPEAM